MRQGKETSIPETESDKDTAKSHTPWSPSRGGGSRLQLLAHIFIGLVAVTLASSMLRTTTWRESFFKSSSNLLRSFPFPRGQPARSTYSVGRSRQLASFAAPESGRQTSFAPPAMSSESFGNFDLLKRTKVPGTLIQVSKWRSRVTGLSVVHLDYEGLDLSYASVRGAKRCY